MIRRHIYITDQQDIALKDLVSQTGIKYAEHMRRAIDEYLMRLEYPGRPPFDRAGWVKAARQTVTDNLAKASRLPDAPKR